VVDDGAVGAEVEVESAAVWTDIVAVVVAIRGNERGAGVSRDTKGVRQIVWRRNSSSGFRALSESDSAGSEGDFGGSGTSGMGNSIRV